MTELTPKQQEEVKKEIGKQLRFLSRSKQTALFFGSEFKKQTTTAVIAAFGFIIALVWRDLIIKLIQENVQARVLEAYPYIAQLYTAIIVTFVSVIGIALITKWSKKPS